MSSPQATRVSDLVAHHTKEIERVSPQPSTSPTQQRAELPTEAPTSPTPKGKDLPAEGELTPQQPEAKEEDTADKEGDKEEAPAPKQEDGEAGADAAANGALEDIAEGSAEAESDAAGEKKDGDAAKADGDAPAAPVVSEGSDAPLAKLLEGLEALPPKEQEAVRTNLARVAEYPRELPLSASWTLFFSDTSGASKSNSAAATKDAYHEGINPIFTATTVPALCGSYKAFKQAPKSKRAKAGDPDSLGLSRPGMNLHFFRSGINPTWEDPYNEKGGRITISPSAALFDSIYERLVFLLAGAALELGTSDLLQTEGPSPGSKRPPTPGPPQEGQINGVVASRRARGDRIEIWLGGKEKKTPVPGEWLDRFKEVLAAELEDPAMRTAKYKKHF
ncbi:hypothetical protein JCM10450v2_004288 [Rhodotorula kratochvilovae]